MNKKIKGYELMKLIAEKQIKVAQGFLFTDADGVEEKIFWDGENFKYLAENSYVLRTVSDIEFVLGDFEILEDEEEIEEEIDIQKLELFEEEYIKARDISMTETELDLIFKTNAIIKYLQQLDKKINKED